VSGMVVGHGWTRVLQQLLFICPTRLPDSLDEWPELEPPRPVTLAFSSPLRDNSC
jgi:hypothetical protein